MVAAVSLVVPVSSAATVAAQTPAACPPGFTLVSPPAIADEVRMRDVEVFADGSAIATGVAQRPSRLVSAHLVGGAWTWQVTTIASAEASMDATAPDDAWALIDGGLAHWDGQDWQLVDGPPLPSLGASDQLDLVDISAVGNHVWVVGWVSRFIEPGRTRTHPYAARLAAGTWTRYPVPDPRGDRTEVSAISGASTDDVWLVGLSQDGRTFHKLTAHWDGASWTKVQAPERGEDGTLQALIAIDAASPWPMAVGYGRPAAVRWDGGWRGAALGMLDVSAGPSDVTVAGRADAWFSGDGYPHVGHWDGLRWTGMSLPKIAGRRPTVRSFAIGARPGGGETWIVGEYTLGTIRPLFVRMCPWEVPDTGPVSRIEVIRSDAPSMLWRFPASRTDVTRLSDRSPLDLFATDTGEPGSTFAFEYPGLGRFPYQDARSGKRGVVVVAPRLWVRQSGDIHVDLGVAAFSTPYRCEYELRDPNLQVLRETTFCWDKELSPTAGSGSYSLRGRVIDTRTGAASDWSPWRSVIVPT